MSQVLVRAKTRREAGKAPGSTGSSPYYDRPMVAVVHAAPVSAAPQAVAAWLDSLAGVYPRDDIESMRAAFACLAERAGERSGGDGEKLVDRALSVATIVAGL